MSAHVVRVLLAVVMLAPVAASAQGSAVNRVVLANGMTVLVREDPSADIVAVSLQARGGVLLETRDTAGITNFLQRAMLRGTKRHSARELAELAEKIGGVLDASGDVEIAELRGTALARHWETLLDLVADVVRNPALAQDEVDRERRLILSQIQTRADNPLPLTLDTLAADLYGPHPYGWPASGRRASVERLTRDDLLAHYRTVYRPERLVVAISGRIERARVHRLAQRLFGKLAAAGDAASVTALAPPGPSGARHVIDRPAQQAQIVVGYLTPGVGEREYAATRVLGALLGGGISGRLFVELRESRGLAYSVGVLSPPRSTPAFLAAYLGTAGDNIEAAEAGILQQIERLTTAPIDEAELARAKAYLAGTLALDRRTNARHAWYLAFYEALGVGWEFPDRYARALEAVTVDDLKAVAARYLTRPTIVVLRPQP